MICILQIHQNPLYEQNPIQQQKLVFHVNVTMHTQVDQSYLFKLNSNKPAASKICKSSQHLRIQYRLTIPRFPQERNSFTEKNVLHLSLVIHTCASISQAVQHFGTECQQF